MPKKLTIEEMREIAASRGGRCLSTEYVNWETHLKWQCDAGHVWKATPNNVKRGTWCPICAGVAKPTIAAIRTIAEENGGKCLSRSYKHAHEKMKWRCEDGHEWEASLHQVKSGSWCPECARKPKYSIVDMRSVAEARCGKCLSADYLGYSQKLLWACPNNHEWEMAPREILGGKWCPLCSSGVGERICREYFNRILGKRFLRVRPKWLTNSRGNLMELDGYCKSLDLGFEYHGKQHYSTVDYFKITTKSLRQRKQDDRRKRRLCRQHKITLIVVPYTVTFRKMGDYIIRRCQAAGIQIPASTADLDFRHFSVYSNAVLHEFKQLAKARGGRLLSKNYVDTKTKLKWKCQNGHEWEAIPSNVKRGAWCPYCAGIVRSGIEEMRQIAKQRGGVCLSRKYTNAHEKLSWQCRHGHRWKATAHDIKSSNTWCPYCAGRGKTISDMNTLARKRGGECLSPVYQGVFTKLDWQCSRGHNWSATPHSIMRGRWCPECAGSKRLTIDVMRRMAEAKEGECLSTDYVNNQTKLKWRCKKGHVWEAIPMNIRKGGWCPFCAGKRKTIEDLQAIATERGGECLSKKYSGMQVKHTWRCGNGHVWQAKPTNIASGTWCPLCSGNAKRTIDHADVMQHRGDTGMV